MRHFELYDPAKTYMYQTGVLATPERVAEDYPAIVVFPHVIEVAAGGTVFAALAPLMQLREQYAIDPALSDTEAVAAIEAAANEPLPEPEPTAEERIAAAMEFQNMVTLMNLEVSMDVEVAKKL